MGRGGGLGFVGGLGRWGGRVGGRRLRLRGDQDERGRRIEGGTLGFEQTQLVEVAMESAVGGVHAALETAQLAAGIDVGLADDGVIVEVSTFGEVGLVWDFGDHDFDFDAAKAAEDELAVSEAVHQGAFFGSAGLVADVVFVAEDGAFGGVFPGEDLGLGLDAGFQGIRGGAGLALGGAWTVALLGIETICAGLFESCHKKRRQARSLSPNFRIRGKHRDFRV